MRTALPLITTLLAAGTATAAPAAITFNQAYLQASAFAEAGLIGGLSTPSDITTTLPPAGLSETAYASRTNAAGTATTSSTVSLTFDDVTSGTAFFSGLGEVSSAGTGVGPVTSQGKGGIAYDFTSDRAFRIRATYEISTTKAGAFGPKLGVNLADQATYAGLYFSDGLDGGGGIVSPTFGPGAYTLNIDYFTIIGLGVADGTSESASLNGSVGFQIEAVPEPATWATLALGFGLVGAAARRRRRVAAA